MLIPNNYDFESEEPERHAAFMQGAIMAQVPGDTVHSMFTAAWPAANGTPCDLMAVIVTAKNGWRHIMGRVRMDTTGAPPGPKSRDDVKHVTQVVFPPKTQVDDLRELTPKMFMLASAATFGTPPIVPIVETRIESDDPNALVKTVEALAQSSLGWDTYMERRDAPEAAENAPPEAHTASRSDDRG